MEAKNEYLEEMKKRFKTAIEKMPVRDDGEKKTREELLLCFYELVGYAEESQKSLTAYIKKAFNKK